MRVHDLLDLAGLAATLLLVAGILGWLACAVSAFLA